MKWKFEVKKKEVKILKWKFQDFEKKEVIIWSEKWSEKNEANNEVKRILEHSFCLLGARAH